MNSDIREYLKENILLFDGGMGTYFARINHQFGSGCELANLGQPDIIRKIHTEYIDAGAKAIKTNTFSANRLTFTGDSELTQKVISRAYEIALSAAQDRAFVFADIGPLSGLPDTMNASEEFKYVADCFIKEGAVNFLFETNADTEGIKEAAKYIRSKVENAFIIVTFAVQPDGYTREGRFADDLIEELKREGYADAFGFNCSCGARHMLELAQRIDHSDFKLVLMPNAGYPVVIDNRTFYEGDPVYYAEQILEMTALGAGIVGGCCGTTPVHIKEVAKRLEERSQLSRTNGLRLKTENSDIRSGEPLDNPDYSLHNSTPSSPDLQTQETTTLHDSFFWEKLKSGRKVIAVELDPPADSNITKFMTGAWNIKDHGGDIITIADCPIARARMDSSILACKIRRELNMDALPHMTCRDRNLNATKALMMGLYSEGIRNVLLITGDPIPSAQKDEVKSVYQFNSRKLAAFARGLNRTLFPTPLHLFGALNLNSLNFDVQLKIAQQKIDNGMAGFLTQPVLSEEAFENLKRAREELNVYILGGIIPIISEKNGRFMDSEVNGISVDPKVIDMYAGLDRNESEDLAKKISVEIAERISPYVDGYYIITPFNRTNLVSGIIDEIRTMK